MRTKYSVGAAALLCLIPSLAHAHSTIETSGGWAQGLIHPLTGLDHIAAMLAVGLWALQFEGKARFVLPLTFMGVLALGGLVGTADQALPWIEQGIILSVLLPGLFLATALRPPLVVSASLIAVFAFCHGQAHGAEAPLGVSTSLYASGFLITSSLLVLGGAALGLAWKNHPKPQRVRLAGVALTVTALGLIFL